LKGYQKSITLIKTGRLKQKHKHEYIKKKEIRGEEEESNINMCNFSANASTYNQ